MKAQERIRLHRFGGLVAISMNDTDQLYLSPENARATARELKQFADNCDKSKDWISTRVIENGKTVTESTGQRNVKYV